MPISLKHLITGQMSFMVDKGFDVTMMSADGPEIDELVQREKCPHQVIPLTRKITPIQDLIAVWVLYKELRKMKPSIVHTHTPKAGLVGMLASWFARVPIRIHTVAGLPLETTAGIKRSVLVAVEKCTYFFASEVWPNSQSLLSFIVENRFAPTRKLNMIGQGSSNGIDLEEFSVDVIDEQTLREVEERVEYSQDNFYLLFVGRVVKDKGIVELVEAFKRLEISNKLLRLIIVGPTEPELDPLPPAVLNEIKTNPKIYAIGYSDKVKYYMHLADTFVFPSHREGFPNVLMQAGLMACPIVASKITGNVDIIQHGTNGLLFEKGNIDSLVSSVMVIVEDKQLRQRMKIDLAKKIVKYFSRKRVQEEVYVNYLRLLQFSQR